MNGVKILYAAHLFGVAVLSKYDDIGRHLRSLRLKSAVFPFVAVGWITERIFVRRADAFAVIQLFVVVVMAIRARIERGNSRFEIFAFMFGVTARAGYSR